MYGSSRGIVSGLSFQQTLFTGYLSDGGLTVPDTVPTVDIETLRKWASFSYVEMAYEITRLFIPRNEIDDKMLHELIHGAFDAFESKEVVKLTQLNDGCQVLELFHGPTLAFKDLGLFGLGRLCDHFLSIKKSRRIAIVATSGDTGSASVEAVKNIPSIDIIVLLPKGRCTRFQELQMTTVVSDNVHVFRVDGTSDELDEVARSSLCDPDFSARHQLFCINSINWSRIMIQIAHFFYAYLKTKPNCDGEVEIVVPTGGCGNIIAAYIACKMGLPLRLVAAVNSNDVIARLIDTGIYSVEGTVIPSLASAMDIQVARNVERLLWALSDGDTELVRQFMETFESTSKVALPQNIHQKMRQFIRGHTVSDEQIKDAMRRCFAENKYIACPHTATALHYHYTKRDENGVTSSNSVPRICVATASPVKFTEVVTSAGIELVDSEILKSLNAKPTRYADWERGEDWNSKLRDYIEQLTAQRRQ